ncbi:MAG: sulfatase-like hydrolase/transferase [Planctomycetaceae bacterium]|jgi:arylsulfatase A-like enzyme|nr:sulfatase-like hydrolase/transferase [Planctomycetaceae bacterium]MBT6155071.1 sulfatase-like hydrolase/transferase [Planctomycetaceae bacterium]MBT6496156.1 sulfatase-like hydrolase/transferase [Planctomycetaceae bacterium]
MKYLLPLFALLVVSAADAAERPNILWITSEDNGPHLGCYGDKYADTPNIDGLAARGTIYLNCWSTAPVCAPARTTLISGLYPPSTGAEHMRSMTSLPDGFRMYPQHLREAGYYCTNNSKEDYNLQKRGKVWDESSRKAHWKNRKDGQPFFAIFNHTISHESRIRSRPHKQVHDPAKVRIPAYHPDTPEVRQDWAQYYDKLTEMDAKVGKNLQELKEAGLDKDTIIFYYGDHGSGMPRSKRWPYNSGLRVPLVIYVPPKFQALAASDYKPSGSTDRLVGFIDFPATLLSLAGIKPPAQFQGHAFMGRHEADEQPYIYGFRGRMDERFDMVRVVRDKRYIYIRNYMPHKVYGQYIAYMFQTPTTQVWKRLYDEGKLTAAQSVFWKTKPPEELYDLESDPDEVNNLAGSAEHGDVLQRLRKAQRSLALKIRDVGFLPEAEIHSRAEGSTPYEMGHDEKKYAMENILAMAEIASSLKSEVTPKLTAGLRDNDSAVRYWAAMGLLMRGSETVANSRDSLRAALADESYSVRVIAAEALGRYGNTDDVRLVLPVIADASDMGKHGVFVSMLALNAMDSLGTKAAPLRQTVQQLPKTVPSVTGRMKGYVPRLIEKALADFNKSRGPQE